ncbi:MAG: BatA domain-containing protein, partial [Pseudomonadota bacterium]
MTVIGGIGFAAPWLLIALVALPLLWLILRAIPPAPIKRLFPGVALLLGLTDDDSVSDRTPWWLLLLRMVAVAAIITGL